MKKIFFVFFLTLLIFSFVQVEAAGLVPCGGPPPEPACGLCHLFVMMRNVINFLLFRIIPSLAALMIAIGGFMYVFTYLGIGGGGPEMINRANTLFKSVIIGLIIAYGAWLVVEAFFAVIGVKPMFRNWHTICPGY